MHSFRSTPQDSTCSRESKSGDRKHWPAWNEADIGRSEPVKVVDADGSENRVARATTSQTLRLENNAWRGTQSTVLVAYAHVFSKKNCVPKSTFRNRRFFRECWQAWDKLHTEMRSRTGPLALT